MKYCCEEFAKAAEPNVMGNTDLRRDSDGWTFYYNCCYGECEEKTHPLVTLRFCPFCGAPTTNNGR